MRHKKKGRALSRTAAHRRALMRNLVTSLFEHGQVTTTIAKAKEARPVAERLITTAKRGGLHSRRLAGSYLRSEDVNRKLFEAIAPSFAERPGGYTRIVRIGRRLGDAGEIGILSLVGAPLAGQTDGGTGAGGAAETQKKRRFPGLRRRKAEGGEAAAAGGAAGEAATVEAPARKRAARKGGAPKQGGPKAGAKGTRGRGEGAAAEGARRRAAKRGRSRSGGEG